MACSCGKPKPGPLGGKQSGGDKKSLTASLGRKPGMRGGSITHVDAQGNRTDVPDTLAARAAVVRRGGSIEFD